MEIKYYPRDMLSIRVTEGTWFQISRQIFMFEIFGRGLWFGFGVGPLPCEQTGLKRVLRVGSLAIMSKRKIPA